MRDDEGVYTARHGDVPLSDIRGFPPHVAREPEQSLDEHIIMINKESNTKLAGQDVLSHDLDMSRRGLRIVATHYTLSIERMR